MSLKSLRKLNRLWSSVWKFFSGDYPYYTVLQNSHKKEYWVINNEGDLVFRNSSYGECIRFIKMNTRNKLR